MVISQVFGGPVPDVSSQVRGTLLDALQAGIAGQLVVLDDAGLTGTGQSSAEVLGLTAAALAETLTGYLIREIVVRGSRGGSLEPLAAQLNHDVTHLQGQRLEGMVGQLAGEVRDALARLDTSLAGVRYSLPPDTAAFTGREEELDRITAAVTQGATAGGVVAICPIGGMPGVGKTALAVHAAQQLAAAVETVLELLPLPPAGDDDDLDWRVELAGRYGTVRPFAEMLAAVIPWGATAAGAPAVAALKALPKLMAARKPGLEHIKGFEDLVTGRGGGWCSATRNSSRR